MKGKTNSSGNSGADIKNSQIEVSTALEKIEANSFIEKTIETSIAQGTVQPRRYRFPRTDYFLIEPRVRTYYHGLGDRFTSSSTKVPIQVEHPDGTKKTVANIPDRETGQSKGYLVQVLPIDTNSFIAVYCRATEGYNSFSYYYNANRIISFAVYELDTTMSAATMVVNYVQLPFVGGTTTMDSSTTISNYLPYCGMAITGVFPTTFDKCFVLSVYRYGTWGGSSNGTTSPMYTGTLIYCDYSKGSMIMTQRDLGCVPIFADLACRVIDFTTSTESTPVPVDKENFQPNSEDGVYERIVAVSQVDSSQNTYTAGLYFLRFDILKTSKNITTYPASFIKSLSSNNYAFAALSEKMSEDNTKKATFVQLMQKDMYGTGNTESLKITISMASDGYVDSIDYVNLSLSVNAVGKYGTESFSVSGTASGYTKMQAIGITDGIMIGLLTHNSSIYYTNSRNGILPVFFASVAESAETINFKLIGLKTLSSYQGSINSFSGELYDFIENILKGEGALQARYAMQTNYNVCFKEFMSGVKKAVASIDGLSKETAASGKPVKIATLKA